eukprot:10308880-Prorocentrum_lima.AAC.1
MDVDWGDFGECAPVTPPLLESAAAAAPPPAGGGDPDDHGDELDLVLIGLADDQYAVGELQVIMRVAQFAAPAFALRGLTLNIGKTAWWAPGMDTTSTHDMPNDLLDILTAETRQFGGLPLLGAALQ